MIIYYDLFYPGTSYRTIMCADNCFTIVHKKQKDGVSRNSNSSKYITIIICKSICIMCLCCVIIKSENKSKIYRPIVDIVGLY